jgi:hypothetical protein
MPTPPQPRRADDLVEGSSRGIGAQFKLIANKQVKLWKALVFAMFIAGFAAALTWAVSTTIFRDGQGLEFSSSEAAPQPSIEGVLAVTQGDDFEHHVSTVRYFLSPQAGEYLPLEGVTGLSPRLSGARVRVQNAQLAPSSTQQPARISGGSMAVVAQPAALALGGAQADERHAAIILVNFSDNQIEPWNTSYVAEQYFGEGRSVDHYLREVSYEHARMTGQVFGWYTLPEPRTPDVCNNPWYFVPRVIDHAEADIDFSHFNSIVVGFPAYPCGLGGYGAYSPALFITDEGEVYLHAVWINGGMSLLGVITHEQGHTYNFKHATSWLCSSQNGYAPQDAACRTREYGNYFDAMGDAYSFVGHFNAIYKYSRDWLSQDSQAKEVTRSDIYAIGPLETASSGVKALVIPRNAATRYFIEYRKKIGFDAGGEEGVLINFWDGQYPVETRLVQANQETGGFFLPVGKSFYDPGAQDVSHGIHNVLITPRGKNASGEMKVEVQFNVPPGDCAKSVACAPASVIGDADQSGTITPCDVDLVSGVLAFTVFKPDNICCIDMNKDGKVSGSDMLYLQDIVAGKETSPGVCGSGGGGGNGAFQESSGQVVMEAEHYHAMNARANHSWIQESGSSYSGGAYMLASPDNSSADGTPTGNTDIVYNVKFQTTGIYYVWVRGYGPNGNGDTVNAGIDGTIPGTSDNMGNWGTSVTWRKATKDGPVATISVPSAGIHTFHLWMREDGFRADKILLTTNANLSTPSGTGPAESERSGGDTPPPPPPPPGGGSCIEAEAGTLVAPFQIANDAKALGGKYVVAGVGGSATYTLTVPTAGTYPLNGRVMGPSGDSNSFKVSVDNGTSLDWTFASGSSWQWRTQGNFSLSAGTHTFVITNREAGTKIDRLGFGTCQ